MLLLSRFIMVGLLLAPTHLGMSGVMLPHSITVFVELEAYVLASFFALLIPIYALSKSEGPSIARRYGRALLMNLKGNLLVLSVLIIVGVYEAVEVIMQM